MILSSNFGSPGKYKYNILLYQTNAPRTPKYTCIPLFRSQINKKCSSLSLSFLSLQPHFSNVTPCFSPLYFLCNDCLSTPTTPSLSSLMHRSFIHHTSSPANPLPISHLHRPHTHRSNHLICRLSSRHPGDLGIFRRTNPCHLSRGPIDNPLLALHDHQVTLPRTPVCQNGHAAFRIHHIVEMRPVVLGPPFSFRRN